MTANNKVSALNNDIAERTINAIYEHGSNVTEFAARLDMTRNQMQKFVDGSSKIPAYMVAEVCRAYDMKPETLLFGDKEN